MRVLTLTAFSSETQRSACSARAGVSPDDGESGDSW